MIRLLLLIVFVNGFLYLNSFAEKGKSSPDLEERITISFEKISLKDALDKLAARSSISIMYGVSKELTTTLVSLKVKNEPLKDVLTGLLEPYALSYKVIDDKIVISHVELKVKQPPVEKRLLLITLKGIVTDDRGKSLSGASVKSKQSNNGAITDKDGGFVIKNVPLTGTLIISFISYQTLEITYDGSENKDISVQLKADSSSLSEVQIVGYGTTTKRFNTGSVSTISVADIEKQPVTNVLSALSGRAPGVFVQTANGLPGGAINIQIRGQNSLRNTPDNNGNYPLYVIDGVPYSSDPVNNLGTTALSGNSIVGAVSPLNSISPDDIESINILKDADATAIYGSRGANGVVLITTKKGKAGNTKVDINYSQGISRVASLPQLLNLNQYLQIRKEAYKNDGITPSSDPTLYPDYAPDLTIWSQTKSTDWAKFLMGNTANSTNLQASVSGGSDQTQFLISTNYTSQGTVLYGGGNYRRGGVHLNLSHTSPNKKFSIQFSSTYTGDDNQQSNPTQLTAEILTPPNFPLYDASGNLNWDNNTNPLADVKANSSAQTNNIVSNAVVGYEILPGLKIKTSVGYNYLTLDQVETFPLSSQNPAYSVSQANYGNTYSQSIIVEPQINYTKKYNRSTFDLLLGGTYQNSLKKGNVIQASNFSNDALIEDASAASTVRVFNNYTDYKYESLFARITYNLDDKYIINASARRDGSSRFGPGDQFGNFGAIGAAWLFSNESFVRDNLNFLSFGKLRSSYGLTGNDQIKDYQYLSTYSSSNYVYQGVAGIQASQISNSNLHWETNKKAEIALDLVFFKDRISLSVDRYQNRSSNQLISYTLPTITGFANYQANLPAVVQNTGWEFELNTVNISSKDFSWRTSFNLTLPKNRLLSFPGLESSSYANTLAIGQDINQGIGYLFKGVDPATGNGQYATLPGTTDPYYYEKFGQLSPYFYGGFGNTLIYKNWSLDIFGQFAKQYAIGGTFYSPGYTAQNSFSNILPRWQNPGDITNVPRASVASDDFYYTNSSANWFNASYFRVKNLALSYTLPALWLKSKKIDRLKIFIQGQNVLTIWKKTAALYDPETGASSGTANIPPMKTFVAGFQLIL